MRKHYSQQQQRWDALSVILILIICVLLFHIVSELTTPIAITNKPDRTTHSDTPSPSRDNAKFTVYMNTFDRDSLLKRCIEHYGRIPHLIDKIIVSWNNINRDPPKPSQFNIPIELIFIKEKIDTLNNRFRPHHDLITTDAILNVDDDIIISYEDIEFAFSIWSRFPNQLIGFSKFCRTFAFNRTIAPCSSEIDGRYHYAASCWSPADRKRLMNYDPIDFTLALDSAVFFHRKYLRLYSLELNEDVKDHITRKRNCEDISLPYMVAIHSKLPAIMIDTIKDLDHLQYENDPGRHVGISRQNLHWELRTSCLNLYMRYMFNGKMPLFRTTFKISRLSYSDTIISSNPEKYPEQFYEYEETGNVQYQQYSRSSDELVSLEDLEEEVFVPPPTISELEKIKKVELKEMTERDRNFKERQAQERERKTFETKQQREQRDLQAQEERTKLAEVEREMERRRQERMKLRQRLN